MKKAQKNWLEWTIFAVSFVIVLGTIAILIYEGISLGKKLPDPQVRLGPAEKHEGYFAVPVTIENRGDVTAENVHLAVELKLPGGESERGEFDLPYLPRHATREAWVTFRPDPAKGKMEPMVLGYQKP